jgi:hypothetical protein
MLKCRQVLCGALMGLLCTVMVCAGCGKKGDPIPRQFKPPAVIADLRAELVAEGINLGWSVVADGRIDSFRMVRSDVVAQQACPGCPQDYRPLETLKISDPRLRREGDRGFGYVDTSVATGRFYSYRVSACDVSGRCAEPSVPAGLFK